MVEQFIRRRIARRLMLVLAALGLTGCSLFTLDHDRAGFYLINRTSAPVDVTYLRGDHRISIAEDLLPGNSLMVNGFVGGGECVSESMLATDQGGGLVATFAGPVCDQSTWEIDVSRAVP